LHPGTPFLGDNILSYHSCTHLTKRNVHLLKPVKDNFCFKVPDIHCSKVQGAGYVATYNYFSQTSYWWLNTASRQMPHKFKNTTIQCHVRTKTPVRMTVNSFHILSSQVKFSHFRSSPLWIFNKNFPSGMFKRFYNHYSFLDGHTVPRAGIT